MTKLNSVNVLQVPTWRWLNINSASLTVPAEAARYSAVTFDKKHEEFIKVYCAPQNNIFETTAALSTKNYVYDNANYRIGIIIPKNIRVDEPICLNFLLDENNPVLIDEIFIEAEENSTATVVISYTSAAKGEFHGKYAQVKVAKNAKLKIVQAQMFAKSTRHLDNIQAEVAEHGNLEIVLAEAGAANTHSECNVVLKGEKAQAQIDSIYVGGRADKLDISHRLEFCGEATQGAIDAKGMLLGSAHKVLKSTLDFIKGAKGAKGKEEENVVTLSDSAVNISSPLLLCGEDDVEGIHATTIGQIDENHQFYLMSRGFNEKEAKIVLIEAAMTPILDKIPDEEIRAELVERIRGQIYDE